MEEIVAELKKDGSWWAEETLEALSQKSPMSLKITLKLLREGLYSDIASCYEREYAVAARRIQDDDFLNAVEAKLNKGNHEFNNWTHKTLEEITDDMVNKYFEPLPGNYRPLKHTIPENAFYPIKKYYKQWPIRVIHWLNEQSIDNANIRAGQDFDVETWFYKCGIDIKDASITLAELRKKVYEKEEAERKIEL